MSMVCGLDLHRQKITSDALDVESGEVWRGRLWHPDRERFRRWLRQDVDAKAHGGPVALAVEGCTGWRYVVEEITAAGYEAHLAEPADIQAGSWNAALHLPGSRHARARRALPAATSCAGDRQLPGRRRRARRAVHHAPGRLR